MGNPNPLLLEADTEKNLERSLEKSPNKSIDNSDNADQHAIQTFAAWGANSSNEDHGYDSDGKSWHDGVLRIRAITTMWSKKSMWSMFALYVQTALQTLPPLVMNSH